MSTRSKKSYLNPQGREIEIAARRCAEFMPLHVMPTPIQSECKAECLKATSHMVIDFHSDPIDTVDAMIDHPFAVACEFGGAR